VVVGRSATTQGRTSQAEESKFSHALGRRRPTSLPVPFQVTPASDTSTSQRIGNPAVGGGPDLSGPLQMATAASQSARPQADLFGRLRPTQARHGTTCRSKVGRLTWAGVSTGDAQQSKVVTRVLGVTTTRQRRSHAYSVPLFPLSPRRRDLSATGLSFYVVCLLFPEDA
jgi:hypothetical protein